MLISYIALRELGITHSRKYIRAKSRKGTFPKPVCGGRRGKPFHWNYDDIADWLKKDQHVWHSMPPEICHHL